MTTSGPSGSPNPCCAPMRPAQPGQARVAPLPVAGTAELPAIPIPGGRALVGTASPLIPEDEEGPLRRKPLKPYRMAPTTVTNAQFARFVDATGYETDAERFGWSFVFWSDVAEEVAMSRGVDGTEWWRRIDGANWRDVNGPGSQETACQPDHPVVHVSWNDAVAFARWAGGRLPSEAEWEHAARGGLGDARFPWGDAAPDDTSHMPCNIWQGRFPDENTCADGWRTTAPAQSYAPNGYGLYNTVGNVWEWTADVFKLRSLKKNMRARQAAMRGFRVLKGGSFLCHQSYCFRYRIAARIGNAPDSTTTHQGFRVVWD